MMDGEIKIEFLDDDAMPAEAAPLITVVEKLTSAIDELKALSQTVRATARMSAFGPDALCNIYYDDEIYPVALPFADYDRYQMRLAETRQPPDDVLLRQLRDLVPTLAGRGLVDVGGYTGLGAVMLARLLGAGRLHVFEPQKVMWQALNATIAANGLAGITHVSRDVIGTEGEAATISATRPDRLSGTNYLRREGGPLTCRSLDALELGDVGLVNIEFNDSKFHVLKGMVGLIERCKPIIIADLSGRDAVEMDEFLKGFNYVMSRAGRHSAIFLPG